MRKSGNRWINASSVGDGSGWGWGYIGVWGWCFGEGWGSGTGTGSGRGNGKGIWLGQWWRLELRRLAMVWAVMGAEMQIEHKLGCGDGNRYRMTQIEQRQWCRLWRRHRQQRSVMAGAMATVTAGVGATAKAGAMASVTAGATAAALAGVGAAKATAAVTAATAVTAGGGEATDDAY